MQSALERALAELVLGPELGASELDALLSRHALSADDRAVITADFERWCVYRRLVRGTLRGAVELAIPRTLARLGPVFDEYLEWFLRERGPRTHYLRDVTTEFLDFCEPLWAKDERVPAWALDLARHEAAQIVMSSLRERLVEAPLGELDLERGLRFVEAARVVHYAFAVQRLSAEAADRTPPEQTPTLLLVYRDPEHDVRYLELSPVAAALLERLLAGATLKEAVLGACAETESETASVLDGTARLLADLAGRGIVLGPALEPGSERLRAARESSTILEAGSEKEPHDRS